ncbi:MAG: hypothetical protein AAF889_00730 [Cyanobacteria bacterium P01_D01_bin.73]
MASPTHLPLLRPGRATAIAPLLLALTANLFPAGLGAKPAFGQTTGGVSAERVRRLRDCIEEFGLEPNNAALQACQLYGAGEEGGITATASTSQTTSSTAATSASSTTQSSSTAQRSPVSQTAAPPRVQTFGPGSITEIPTRGDGGNSNAAASRPQPAAESGPTSSTASEASTPRSVSDRQRAILGCLGDHGTDNRNAALAECGAWEPDASAPPTSSPSTTTPVDGTRVSAVDNRGDRSSRSVTSRSTGGGFSGNGSGASPDRRSLSDPAQSSPGGGSAGRTAPAFNRQDSGSLPGGTAGAPEPGAAAAAPPVEGNESSASGDDEPITIDDLAIASSSDASQRGQVSDDFDDRRLANFICREITRSFVRCDPDQDEIANGDGGDGSSNGNDGGGAIASSVSGAISFTCNESESTLRTRGVTRVTQGQSTIYVGFAQVSANNQDPRIARFDNGQQVWCREDYEITGDDSTGYGLVWDGGDRLYAAFTSTGTRGTPDQDFRRFATNGWLTSYGAGGGPSVTVLAQISPNTGDVQRATFISALQNNGASNTLRLTELGLGTGGVTIRATSFFSPRRPDRSAFSCSATGVGGFDYTATFTSDLSNVTQASAPGCS